MNLYALRFKGDYEPFGFAHASNLEELGLLVDEDRDVHDIEAKQITGLFYLMFAPRKLEESPYVEYVINNDGFSESSYEKFELYSERNSEEEEDEHVLSWRKKVNKGWYSLDEYYESGFVKMLEREAGNVKVKSS
jgi:hypothetical protein